MALSRAERWLAAGLVALAAASVFDGARWLELRRVNQAILAGEAAALGERAPSPARFAQAYALDAKGDWEAALALYRELEDAPERSIAVAARYNSGNIYLREALHMASGEEPQQALPLAELAKRAYREVLRLEPAYWDARYNLERSLRLAPEAAEVAADESEPPPPAERAVTTMRGFTLGLP